MLEVISVLRKLSNGMLMMLSRPVVFVLIASPTHREGHQKLMLGNGSLQQSLSSDNITDGNERIADIEV